MQIRVVTNVANSHARRIESAVSLINGCQHKYHLVLSAVEEFSKTEAEVDAEALSKQVEVKWPHEYVVLLTEDPLDDNWFSHEYRNSAVITTSEWEEGYAPPSLRAFVMYQIAQALIHFAADMSEEMALNIVHDPPVGCVFDMCTNKGDIKLGMVAGNVCHRCVGQLRALGTAEGAIDAAIRIASLVRTEALGRPLMLEPTKAFVVMRFSKNDENDNAWEYGIKKGLEECGLLAVRADDRVESGQLLEKIDRNIRSSRLVVVKVDENNLNVYFELGLAMGVEKDVLLISENSLVLNLPTDLKNWECLTYEKGNYKQLAQDVSRFLEQRYNLQQKR